MQTIKCTHCNKTLLEAHSEVKKKCPSCKEYTHVVVTSCGVVDLKTIEEHRGLSAYLKEINADGQFRQFLDMHELNKK